MERGPGGEARVVDLVGQLSLGEVAALAREAAVYVGNDSGPTHLAEAAGANVVMLFGPSDPIAYGPRSRRATAISSGFWCSPCFVDGRVAPCANVICMEALPVERVWRLVAPFLVGAAAR
jgi:ADP-heptose:LPS heptosyltransferase